MNPFKGFKNRVKGAAETFTTTSSSMWGSLSSTIKSPANWLKWFKISPRLKAVDKIANDVASIDIQHQDSEGNEIEDSPVIALLNKPNHLPEFTRQQLIRMTSVHIKLLGEAFWIIEKEGRKNSPSAILPIPPTWIQTIPRKASDTHYTVRTSDGIVYGVPKENMVLFKRLDIEEPYKRGQGDSQQIGDELQLDEFMTKHQNLLFKNGAMPPVAISMKGAKLPERLRFAAEWMSKFAGVNKRHVPVVYDGDSVDVKILQQTMKDLDFLDSRKFIQNLTLEHYMIPKELIGKVENSNRATITQANIIYEKNALKPEVTLIENTLNNQYLPMWNLSTSGKLIFVNYLTEDVEFNRDTGFKGWENGLMTRNEARQLSGMDETPDGDVYKLKLNEFLVPRRNNTPAIEPVTTVIDVAEDDLINIVDDEGKAATSTGKKF